MGFAKCFQKFWLDYRWKLTIGIGNIKFARDLDKSILASSEPKSLTALVQERKKERKWRK